MRSLLVSVALLTALTLAQTPPAGGPGTLPPPQGHEMGNPIDHLAKVLKLDAAKTEAAKKIFAGVQAESAKLHIALARKSLDRKELELSDKPDLAAFRKNAEERAKINVDLEMARTAGELEMKKLLTAEQWTTFLHMKNMREKMMRARGPQGHMGMPEGMGPRK